jgi:starch-binding outer membrane protein, SusD/RagB family
VKIDGAAPASTTADLATARTAVEDAIAKSAKQNSFADVFKYANKGNNEIIFAIRFQIGEATNNYGQFIYAQTDPMASFVNVSGTALTSEQAGASASDPLKVAGGGSIIRYEYKYDLFAKYDTAIDLRARATFFDFYKNPVATNKFVNLRKFLGAMDGTNRSFADDVPIYRWAEAMLILAEIKNKQGQDPSAEINAVRLRAYGSNAYPVLVNGSFEQNEIAIFEERGKELVAEGKRWYDLRRMQDATGDPLAFRKDLPLVGVLDKATQEYRLLWPIDRSTLTNDLTLEQNPGYPGT